MQTQKVVENLKSNEQAAIQRLMDWLRIPSVSTDPAYREDVARAGEWCAERLREAGFETRVMPTGSAMSAGHPVVLAHTPGDTDYKGPHVLFYGHYDVQPAEPLELWDSPPYEPVIRPAKGNVGERIVARGACDDKGQVATFLEAMRAWKEVSGKAAGGVKMTVLIEGEEESGSANLEKFVEENKDELGRCDVCVISDTGMLGRGKPAITYGVRGLVYTEVTLHGPDQDLHSGLWGGRVPNPVNELSKVLAQLWDTDRRVTIPGFYDDVRPIGDDERAQWKKLGVDAAAALATIGLGPDANVGEAGFTSVEREWARPTCDINGIYGGYMGKGAKTVIASKATAKVSFRLVADQEPKKVADAFFAWLNERTPAGCKWELTDMGGGYPATTPTDSPTLRAAVAALKDSSGNEAALIKSGGSIPIAGMLKAKLGLDTIFMGFGLEDDRVHSPNEKFELDCFRLGLEAHARLIEKLWAIKGA
ncbi:MAG: dipeptidase [Phycisphaerales bacterium]|nr:dipeptidase [Phycisphaerales bacterium]MCB9836398.1 dipeptidase [Phycisphaera sp.]